MKNADGKICKSFYQADFHSSLIVLAMLCAITLFLSKNQAKLSNIFLEGKVKSEEVYRESDGEMAAEWSTVYWFEAKSKIGKIVSNGISGLCFIMAVVLPCLTMNYCSTTTELLKKNQYHPTTIA